MTHDFLSIYAAKGMEYLLAISYLLLFIPFWRYVQGSRKASVVRVGVPARAAVEVSAAVAPVAAIAAAAHAAPVAALGHVAPLAANDAAAPAAAVALPRAAAGWFFVPPNVHLHPGHTWARLEADGLVSVGLDDFAHKLVGPAAVRLPSVGAYVAQGEAAAELGEGLETVGLVSPVDGTVVAVNDAVGTGSSALEDPYGAGWLFKVDAPRLAANLRQLFKGHAATRLVDDAGEALALRLSPEIGHVLQDGGAPVHGIARALAGDEWAALARGFLLT
jgi:glycine cleavage system H protein